MTVHSGDMGYTIGLLPGSARCKPMDERLKFIARLLDGEKMAVACRHFGISRKTGYKILTRYNEIGLDGITDAHVGPIGTPTSCRSRSRRRSAIRMLRSGWLSFDEGDIALFRGRVAGERNVVSQPSVSECSLPTMSRPYAYSTYLSEKSEK